MQKKTFITPFIFLSLLFGTLFPTNIALAANEPSAENPWCIIQQDGTAGECFATAATCGPASGGMGCENYNKFKPAIQKSFENAASLPKKATDAILTGVSGLIMDGIALIAQWINEIAAIFLTQMAYILDAAIDVTIKSSTYAELAVVNIGWTAVRDFSNMFFIFALLYIAILTILGLAGSNTKRWVAHLIIGALLINFSLFATKVVIDAGNVLAVGFWEKLKSDQGSEEINSAAAHFMQGFKIQSAYSNTDAKANGGAGETLPMDSSTRALIFFGGAIMMFIAGYLFLAGAIMMIVRTVTLILLMIFSPFAFLGFSLPKGGGFAHTWLNKLIGSTFVAPAFIFMLYLNALIISSLDDEKLASAAGSNASAAFLGSAANFPVILNFVTMAILLLSSMTVANAVSSGAGTQAGSLSKKLLGYGGGLAVGAAGIAGGRLGRQVGGSLGRVAQNSKAVQRLAAKDNLVLRNFGRAVQKTGQKMSEGTWDVRNTGAIKTANKGLALTNTGITLQGTGEASKKSFTTHGGLVGGAVAAGTTAALRKAGAKEWVDQEPLRFRGSKNEEELIKEAKERFKGNPKAQELFLKDHGVQLDAARNKEISNEIKREERKKENVKDIEERLKTQAGVDLKEIGKMKPEEIEALNKKIEENMGQMAPDVADKFVKEFSGALEKISGKEYADMGQNFLNLALVQRAANGKHLAEVNTRLSDGTMVMDKPQEYSDKLAQTVFTRGTDGGKSWMRNQMRQGNSSLTIDGAGELNKALAIADEDEREKSIRNAMSFMSHDQVAGLQNDQLLALDPYLTDGHYKAMGTKKRTELKKLIEDRDTAQKAAITAQTQAAQAAKDAAEKTKRDAALDAESKLV
jgi:hypothetical protein